MTTTLIASLSLLAAAYVPQNPARVAEIERTLPEKAELLWPAPQDRAAWAPLAKDPGWKKFRRRADGYAKQTVPDLPEELYMEYFRNGTRKNYEGQYFTLTSALQYLTVAECVEWKGRYVPHVERWLRALLAQPTWVLPAHDRQGKVYRGQAECIDLFSSECGWCITLTLRLLEGKLDAALAEEARRLVRRRIVDPYVEMAEKEKTPCAERCWWRFCENNWNRVCHSGCCNATLLLEDDRHRRAEAVEFAERSIPPYFVSFGGDGYCGEGMGYWNYGFGKHMIVGLTVRRATGGKVNMLAGEDAARAAAYGSVIRLNRNGVSPQFADGGGKPSPTLCDLGADIWPEIFKPADCREVGLFGGSFHVETFLLRAFRERRPCVGADEPLPLRTAFEKSGVYVLRGGALTAAVKCMNLGENHGHSDAGSYVVADDRDIFAGDPGGERYTARTFSKDRFKSKVLNSYGHPVPLVDGRMQADFRHRGGPRPKTRIVRTDFTDARDEIVVDLTGAYPGATNLVSLTRTFVYDRAAGAFTVRDAAKFSRPSAFESPIVTLVPDRLAGRYSVTAKGGAWEVREEVIENPDRKPPTRLAVAFKEPVTEAETQVMFKLPKEERK